MQPHNCCTWLNYRPAACRWQLCVSFTYWISTNQLLVNALFSSTPPQPKASTTALQPKISTTALRTIQHSDKHGQCKFSDICIVSMTAVSFHVWTFTLYCCMSLWFPFHLISCMDIYCHMAVMLSIFLLTCITSHSHKCRRFLLM